MDPAFVLEFINTWGVLGGLVLLIIALQKRGLYTKAQVDDIQTGYERQLEQLKSAHDNHIEELRGRFQDAQQQWMHWRDVALRTLNVTEEAVKTDHDTPRG